MNTFTACYRHLSFSLLLLLSSFCLTSLFFQRSFQVRPSLQKSLKEEPQGFTRTHTCTILTAIIPSKGGLMWFYGPDALPNPPPPIDIHTGLHLICIHYDSWRKSGVTAFCVVLRQNLRSFYRLDALPVTKPTVSKHWKIILAYILCPKKLCHFYFCNIFSFCRPILARYLSILTAFSTWTWVSWNQNVPVLNFIGAKDIGGGGFNSSYKTCEAPVRVSASTNQHPVYLQARCHSYCPTVSKHLREI